MKKFFTILALAITLTACATDRTISPQTGTEKYVAADGVYKALSYTVQGTVENGTDMADIILSSGINLLLQKQRVDALITFARSEDREFTSEELAKLKSARDTLAAKTDTLLDGEHELRAALGGARAALDVWAIVPNDPDAQATTLISLQAIRSLLRAVKSPTAGPGTTAYASIS